MIQADTLPEAQSVSSRPEIWMGKPKIFESHLKRKVKGKVRAMNVADLGTRTGSNANFLDYTLDHRFFGIQKIAHICGGEPCVAGTRITVRTLDKLYRQGEPFEKLAKDFHLEPWQVEVAVEYANRHREEIDELIRQNERA